MSKYIECGRSGIYFLLDDWRIVYVGSTTDFPRRVTSHYDKRFTRIRFIECSDYKYQEKRWMRYFRPKYNIQIFSKEYRRGLILEGKFCGVDSKFIDY